METEPPKSVLWLDLGPHTFIADVWFDPLTVGAQAVSDSVPSLNPVPLSELPGWASMGEDVLNPAGIGCSRVGWYPRYSEKGRQ